MGLMYCLLIRVMSTLECAIVVFLTAFKTFSRVLALLPTFKRIVWTSSCCQKRLFEFDELCYEPPQKDGDGRRKTNGMVRVRPSCYLECTYSVFLKRKPLFHEVDGFLQVQGCCFMFVVLSENYCYQRVKLSVCQEGGGWICIAWIGWNMRE